MRNYLSWLNAVLQRFLRLVDCYVSMVFLARALLLLCCFWVETSSARRARWRRFQDGKFIIGALFPITRGPGCAIVLEQGLLLAEAFIYKLNAHRNGSLSSGAAIGYDLRDTCSNPAGALKEVLDILRENGGFSRKNCSLTQAGKSCGLVAVVGPDLSGTAVVTSGVLSAYRVPQVRLKHVDLFHVTFTESTSIIFKNLMYPLRTVTHEVRNSVKWKLSWIWYNSLIYSISCQNRGFEDLCMS